MEQILLDLQLIQNRHEQEIDALKKQLEMEILEKDNVQQRLDEKVQEVRELNERLLMYKDMEDELVKLRIFKETIITSISEKTIVKDGFGVFKMAQKELTREAYLLVVKHTKDFNAKQLSKEDLLKNIKNICSHSLYLEFVQMVQ